MIDEFLKKYQSEIFDQKIDLKNAIQNSELKLKEINTFIDILEKNRDLKYESFTPYEINHEDKEKIAQLKTDKRKLKSEIEESKKKLVFIEERLVEINHLIYSKKTDQNQQAVSEPNYIEKKSSITESNFNRSLCEKLERILNYMAQDSNRAKLELKEIILQLKTEETKN